MNVDSLKNLYNENLNVGAICDEMAGRERNQSETKLTRILARLQHKGIEIRKHEAIAAFRALEAVGCGQYIEGRHGWPSRFVWSVNSLSAGKTAQGATANVEPLPEHDEEAEIEAEIDTYSHSLRLRDDFDVEIQLPTDLTAREAERLAAFVTSLPIED